MFSSAFFGIFFLGTVCLGSFVFPGAFLAFFLGRIGGILLSPCVVASSHVSAGLSVAFPFFFFRCASYAPFALGSQSANLIPASSASALLFSGVFVAVFRQLLWVPRVRFRAGLRSLWPTLFISPARPSLLHTMQGDSLPVFRHGSPPVSGIVSRICFQLCLGCCQLVFFSCRCVGIAAFFCLPSPLFLSTRALAWPFLAR